MTVNLNSLISEITEIEAHLAPFDRITTDDADILRGKIETVQLLKNEVPKQLHAELSKLNLRIDAALLLIREKSITHVITPDQRLTALMADIKKINVSMDYAIAYLMAFEQEYPSFRNKVHEARRLIQTVKNEIRSKMTLSICKFNQFTIPTFVRTENRIYRKKLGDSACSANALTALRLMLSGKLNASSTSKALETVLLEGISNYSETCDALRKNIGDYLDSPDILGSISYKKDFEVLDEVQEMLKKNPQDNQAFYKHLLEDLVTKAHAQNKPIGALLLIGLEFYSIAVTPKRDGHYEILFFDSHGKSALTDQEGALIAKLNSADDGAKFLQFLKPNWDFTNGKEKKSLNDEINNSPEILNSLTLTTLKLSREAEERLSSFERPPLRQSPPPPPKLPDTTTRDLFAGFNPFQSPPPPAKKTSNPFAPPLPPTSFTWDNYPFTRDFFPTAASTSTSATPPKPNPSSNWDPFADWQPPDKKKASISPLPQPPPPSKPFTSVDTDFLATLFDPPKPANNPPTWSDDPFAPSKKTTPAPSPRKVAQTTKERENLTNLRLLAERFGQNDVVGARPFYQKLPPEIQARYKEKLRLITHGKTANINNATRKRAIEMVIADLTTRVV